MKKYALIIVLLLVVSAYAVVEITLTVPDTHVNRVVAMMEAFGDTHISFHVQGSRDPNDPNEPDYSADGDFRIETDPNETTTQYAKRFVRTVIIEMVRAHETKLANDERKAAIEAIAPVDVNVPDEIIE